MDLRCGARPRPGRCRRTSRVASKRSARRATNSANLLVNSPPVDCSLATDANCIIQYRRTEGDSVPVGGSELLDGLGTTTQGTTPSGGPIPTGSKDPAHVDGWNFQDMFFVTFKAAYLTALGFDFSNYDIADFDPATNTFTCDPNKWCIAPNPTALHNSPAKPCPSVSPSPTPTPTPVGLRPDSHKREIKNQAGEDHDQNDNNVDDFLQGNAQLAAGDKRQPDAD